MQAPPSPVPALSVPAAPPPTPATEPPNLPLPQSLPPPLPKSLPINLKPAYTASPGSPLHADRTLYTRLATTPHRRLVESFEIPIRSARAWRVPAKHLFRLSTPHGAQVGDLNIWSAHNPRERFWASRTRQLHASHLTTFDRLWSTLPYLRPLATITADTITASGRGSGRVHDLLGTRCDPYVNALLTGGRGQFDFHCHSNLVRAVAPWGLDERDVHDVLNVFQVTALDAKGRYCMEASPAVAGDYLEFFAETDLLVALSACPGGDLSKWGWEGGDMVECCRPLGVEVWEVTDESVLDGWKEPERPGYTGGNGLVPRVWGEGGEEGETK
ncbi:hypothetical protein EDC01DRAFT_676692 [Geopyxis carbonaria]|nr:hypothetical protein EDC01DRAFT_676692 [Geopyxis carbonaria]